MHIDLDISAYNAYDINALSLETSNDQQLYNDFTASNTKQILI